jgi:hypothetical protein
MNTSVEHEQEIWKDIPGHEGYYQVSSLGRVKSIKRKHSPKENLLTPYLENVGYLRVTLRLNRTKKKVCIHKLVAMAFLNHTPCGYTEVVNHKNFIRTDNRLCNLELVSQRQNTNKKHINSSSIYTGVCWDKKSKKWTARIKLRGKSIDLGRFDDEIEASEYYQDALLAIQNNTEIVVKRVNRKRQGV